METRPGNGQSVARVSGLSHVYGKKLALDSVTVNFPAGCMVGLLGPDGVGKSTLMSIISGVRQIQKGTVDVLGGDMADVAHRKAVCPRIAYMPQGLGRNLYMTLSIAENLDFFGRLFGQDSEERKRRIDDLTTSTGLFPFLNRPAGKLSGGMKQKLGLCCSLIHDPDLLILDEPTTGVDPLSRRQFWELIRRIRRDRPQMSVMVSTAYMDEASGFDWLICMDDGKILAEGTANDLKSRVGADNLDTAFLRLLPEEKRKGHQELVVVPREVKVDGNPAIQAEGLTQRFGDFTAVDRVSFKIAKGEIFGFLGSNGCGKTTTMKMLTGLLPPTGGTAFMFGERVTGKDLETRKRIGFMSQAFSLYSELTVRQNLVLHAHLFELAKDAIEPRIQELAKRFGLESYMTDLAESLPLGARQRLSLAVALIHKPELLILDEPTSGVDPVAREGFWELLIELSRKDQVTIFVSTHFMNEAAWCDRISLMHGGKVLDSDAPAKLIAKRGSKTLEEAFISYLEEASGAPATAPTPTTEAQAPMASRAPNPSSLRDSLPAIAQNHGTGEGFSWRRMLGYAYREALEVKRDPIRLTFALAGTALLMMVLGAGIDLDVDQVAFSAFDRDRTPESREYIANIGASSYFTPRPPTNSEQEAMHRLRSGELDLALEIPPQFGKDLQGGRRPEVSAWVDGSQPSRSGSVAGYIQGVTLDFLDRNGPKHSTQRSLIAKRYRYNQDFKSIYAMVPAIMAILLLVIPTMLSALGVVREKELGSITNFYATPVTHLEFILGKQTPYIFLGMINYLTMVVIAIAVFGVPIKGSFAALTVGAFLYVVATTSLGMVMSAFANTQLAAITSAAVVTLLPAVSFCGMLQPVASLEGGEALVGHIYPTTYFITITRGAFTKALGFGGLSSSFWPLVAAIPVLLGISLLLLRKQEK